MIQPEISSHSHELAQRKQDHIELAQRSQTSLESLDARFNYEPLFFTHPSPQEKWPSRFLNFSLDWPIWISSMTGGHEHAKVINQNLSRLCGEHKLGMGLGSCRPLLSSQERREDFSVRKNLGNQPLFANLGIAQLEEMVSSNRIQLVHDMVKELEADGLIIHINPLQEWFQPEGDRLKVQPILTLTKFLEKTLYPVLIKEVGQGMGPRSLKALLEMPIAGIELAAFGGTNFSYLEALRKEAPETKKAFTQVGHSASEMVGILNALPVREKEFIISGGMKNVLDGYELKMKLKANSVIGMAQSLLGPARESYESLQKHFFHVRESLLVANGLLELKEEK